VQKCGDVCPWSFYVVLPSVERGLATNRPLIQGVPPYVVKSDYGTELTGARAVEPLKMVMMMMMMIHLSLPLRISNGIKLVQHRIAFSCKI
jgi:hypothetical protein